MELFVYEDPEGLTLSPTEETNVQHQRRKVLRET